jgi:hypothetical protein
VAIGGGGAVLVGLINLATHWPPHLSHQPDYGALAALLSPFLLWGWKVRREGIILKYGDAHVGQITSLSDPLPVKDWPIQLASRTRLRFISYEYTDSSGTAQRGGKLDWWLKQRVGEPVFIFTDPRNPRRSVLHGCCTLRVRGLEL